MKKIYLLCLSIALILILSSCGVGIYLPSCSYPESPSVESADQPISNTNSEDSSISSVSIPESVSTAQATPIPSSSSNAAMQPASPAAVTEGDVRYIVRVENSVYLRREASDSVDDENIITCIPVLTKVLQLGQESDYSFVEYNGIQGYVKSEYLASTPFENTYWWWGRGVTNGSQYVMETLSDGSFYAITLTGSEKRGFYTFDGDYITIDNETYHLTDGKFETV